MNGKRYSMAALGALLIAANTHAADIEVSALFNGKAMVSIDQGNPRLMSVGQTLNGVKLINANSAGAVFEINGKKQSIGLGQAISTSQAVGARPTLKLEADSGGHFLAYGSVNGRPIRFLVDTGATVIALSAAQAEAIGIDLKRAERSGVSTASGYANAYRVVLDNVKVGDISLNLVEATVIDSMPGNVALLGNSFLSRLELKREGTVLTLTKNY